MKETTQHAGWFLGKEIKDQRGLLEIKEKTDEVMINIWWRENFYLRGAYIYDWVKWPKRDSDQKRLYNVEITSGTILISL
jgi:hypothetical protein